MMRILYQVTILTGLPTHIHFRNVIFSPNVIQETWTLLQEASEEVKRVEGAPPGGGPYLVGPSELHRRTPSSYIHLSTPK